MTTTRFRKKICAWKEDVDLASFSSYRIGGPARLFLQASSQTELIAAFKFCKENNLQYYILGRGSNTLFDDRGFDGAVISNDIRGFEALDDGLFQVWAGSSFPRFGAQCAKLGFGGLEYAIGIPGTVGGALFMNAGASGQEISSVVESVDYLHESGEVETFSREQLVFKYRWSSFHEMKGVILSAKLKLYPCLEARDTQMKIIYQRKASQPYTEPSCGCIFKNGEDYSAGQLIDELGLKGYQIGGAQISRLHANFIVNVGGASSYDVKDLIEKIERDVLEKKKISLKREIRFVPFERGRNAL